MASKWIWERPDWPNYVWDLGRLTGPLGGAREALGRIQMFHGVLDLALSREALAEVLAVEGACTSAIEGQELNPASVAASVRRHLGLAVDASAPLDRKAEGIVGVLLDACDRIHEPLTVDLLCRWQGAIFPESASGPYPITMGELRKGAVSVVSGPLGRETIHFEGVPQERLSKDMEAFLTWFNASRKEVDGLVRAGAAHLWFLTIHPFDDGNGRVGRALVDRALAQDQTGRAGFARPTRGGQRGNIAGEASRQFPLSGKRRPDLLVRVSSRILSVKSAYHQALGEASRAESGMDITPWLAWFLHQVQEACAHSERMLGRTLAKTRFWAAHRETHVNERQRKALNRLLDAGQGGFEGQLTPKKYASLTKCSSATATRDLAALMAVGCLTSVGGGGRSAAYDIPWDRYTRPAPYSLSGV